MRMLTLLGLLFFTNLAAFAADCDSRYKQAEQAHDRLVALEHGSKQFFADLEKLEDKMFESMRVCDRDARIVAQMSEIQITARQAPLAQLYAQKALDINPDTWQSQHAMGSVLTLVQQYDKAIPHLDKASQLAPNRTGLKLSLCRTQAIGGKHAGAIKTCTRVIQSDEQHTHALAYYFRSLAYKGIHEEAKALEDINNAKALGLKVD